MSGMSFLGIVVLLVAIRPGYGNLIAPRSLVDLEQNADVIVVGTASGTVQTSSSGFFLQVGRVIKGDTSLVGSVVTVTINNGTANAAAAGTPSAASGTGLWFLQRLANNWVLLPVTQGSVPFNLTFFPTSAAPILSTYAYGPSAMLSDKVASEVCAAIEAAGGTFPMQFVQLHNGLLDQLNSSVVTRYYQRMSNSASVQQQILGLSGLIRSGSDAALATVAQARSGFAAYPVENGILLQSIRDYFRAADANSITTLGQAAVDSTTPTALREADAHALAAIHTTGTLPYLATLLGDSDSNLQVEAVGGMAAFANGLPIQTMATVASLAYLQFPPNAPYRTPETMANFAMGPRAIQQKQASYVAYWKQWWSQQRSSLGY